MKHFATHYPVRFALLVALTLVVVDGTLALVLPRFVEDARVLEVTQDAAQYALALGLLLSLGWWRRAGFARLPGLRSLLVLLPLLILPALQLVTFKLGTHDGLMLVVIVETAIAAGFTEEALFRGVILRAVEPLGLFRAAGLSAVLFGLVHVVNLAAGANLLATVDQIIGAAALGFAFAAVVLVTETIWPVIVIHGGMDILGMLTVGDFINRQSPGVSVPQLLIGDAVSVVLLVGYGYWLLRRHQRNAERPSAPAPGTTVGPAARRALAGR